MRPHLLQFVAIATLLAVPSFTCAQHLEAARSGDWMAFDSAAGISLPPAARPVPQFPARGEMWRAERSERSIWPWVGVGALVGAGVGALITSTRYDPGGDDWVSPQMAYGFGIASGAAAGALIGAWLYWMSGTQRDKPAIREYGSHD